MAASVTHDELVFKLQRYVCRKYDQSGNPIFEVDCPGGEKPRRIDGKVPDLYFKSSYNEIIGEAKTADDINTDRSKEQLATFMNRARTSHGIEFLLLVPICAVDIARQVLDEIELRWDPYANWMAYAKIVRV